MSLRPPQSCEILVALGTYGFRTLEGSIVVHLLIDKLKTLARYRAWQDCASIGQETSIDGGRSRVGRDGR
jgi:hypothetical protein